MKEMELKTNNPLPRRYRQASEENEIQVKLPVGGNKQQEWGIYKWTIQLAARHGISVHRIGVVEV
jgi:hypothetical protein